MWRREVVAVVCLGGNANTPERQKKAQLLCLQPECRQKRPAQGGPVRAGYGRPEEVHRARTCPHARASRARTTCRPGASLAHSDAGLSRAGLWGPHTRVCAGLGRAAENGREWPRMAEGPHRPAPPWPIQV